MKSRLILGCILMLTVFVVLTLGCGGGDSVLPTNWEDALVFVSNPTQYEEVRFMFIDGTSRQTIAAAGDRGMFQGVLSPNGKKILYVDDARSFIVYDLRTGGRMTLFHGGGDALHAPAYSPDGSKISFSREGADGSQDLWVMNANGTNAQRLTNDGNRYTNDSLSSWSRDGNWIYFQRGRQWYGDICRISATGGNVTVIKASNPGAYVYYMHPRVLRSGKILFTRSTGAESQKDIYVMNANGASQINLTPGTSGTDEFFASANYRGTMVAYSRDNGSQRDIIIADFDGVSLSNHANLTADIAADCWRPSLGIVDMDYYR
ncbi:MAG: hypothetical protein GX100_03110 [candidate division WS1 bacterium]|nr:hypothetical protein [candidate division WS1 bacterium]